MYQLWSFITLIIMTNKKIIIIGAMLGHELHTNALHYHRLEKIEPIIITGLTQTKHDVSLPNVLDNNIVMKMNHSYNTNLIVKDCINKRNKFVNKPKFLRKKK